MQRNNKQKPNNFKILPTIDIDFHFKIRNGKRYSNNITLSKGLRKWLFQYYENYCKTEHSNITKQEFLETFIFYLIRKFNLNT